MTTTWRRAPNLTSAVALATTPCSVLPLRSSAPEIPAAGRGQSQEAAIERRYPACRARRIRRRECVARTGYLRHDLVLADVNWCVRVVSL